MKLARLVPVIFVLPILVLVHAPGALAQSCTPVLDQENADIVGGGLALTATQTVDQTFTVGSTGTLARIDLWVRHHQGIPTEDLVFELTGTTGGAPSGPVLASMSFTPAEVPTNSSSPLSIDMTPFNVNVVAGEVLALRPTANVTGPTYAWEGGAPDPYAGGSSFINGALHTFRDMGFRTFVCSDTVPSTSLKGLILMAIAFLVAAATLVVLRRAGPI